jgi:hypothetical protein
MEIVWKKAKKSINDGGDECVWVADVRRLRESLGHAAILKINETTILDTTDVVVRDEDGTVCQYTHREFYVFLVGVKNGDFDEYLELIPDEEKTNDGFTRVRILHNAESPQGVNLGELQIDDEGNIKGKIYDQRTLDQLKSREVRFSDVRAQFHISPLDLDPR